MVVVPAICWTLPHLRLRNVNEIVDLRAALHNALVQPATDTQDVLEVLLVVALGGVGQQVQWPT